MSSGVNADEVLHRVYDALFVIGSRIQRNRHYEYAGVQLDEIQAYHRHLDRLEEAGYRVAEWRIPDDDIIPARPGTSSGGAELYSAKVTLERFIASCVPVIQYLKREKAKLGEEGGTRQRRQDQLNARREKLLDTFVTAYLESPDTIRGLSGDDAVTLFHPGFPDNRLQPNWGDVQALADSGRLMLNEPRRGQFEIRIPPRVLEPVMHFALPVGLCHGDTTSARRLSLGRVG